MENGPHQYITIEHNLRKANCPLVTNRCDMCTYLPPVHSVHNVFILNLFFSNAVYLVFSVYLVVVCFQVSRYLVFVVVFFFHIYTLYIRHSHTVMQLYDHKVTACYRFHVVWYITTSVGKKISFYQFMVLGFFIEILYLHRNALTQYYIDVLSNQQQ